MATEKHGRINALKDFSPCNSVCFRGKNICLYQVEAVLEYLCANNPAQLVKKKM